MFDALMSLWAAREASDSICKHLNITRSSVSNSVFWTGSALVILIKGKKLLIVMSDSYQLI